MFALTDSIGKPLFETMSITLVCDECLKSDCPEKCVFCFKRTLHTIVDCFAFSSS
jgi:hypothetical protein